MLFLLVTHTSTLLQYIPTLPISSDIGNSEMKVSEKIQGLVYGQLVGDALGSRYEFQTKEEVLISMRKDIKGDHLPLLGGGPFQLVPGQVTDDSELALCLLYSVVKRKGYDREHVAGMYREWLDSNPFDIGVATKSAFSGTSSYQGMVSNSEKRDQVQGFKSLSNGSLMRVSPLALLSLIGKSREEVVEASKIDSRMTHTAEEVHDANAVYVSILVDLLYGVPPDVAVKSADKGAKTKIVSAILQHASIGGHPSIGVLSDHSGLVQPDGKLQGYYGVALHNAIYQLLHGKSFHQSMVDTILLGGDTDTNCAICGSLLGAKYGVNGIPSDWINLVKSVPHKPPNRSHPPPVCQKDVDSLISLIYK